MIANRRHHAKCSPRNL